jgi:hypothetical protein
VDVYHHDNKCLAFGVVGFSELQPMTREGRKIVGVVAWGIAAIAARVSAAFVPEFPAV